MSSWYDLDRDINIRAYITTIQSGSVGRREYPARLLGRYTIDEDSADSGLAFGTASSASYTLQILRENNVRNISALELLGATVEVDIGLWDDELSPPSYNYEPFGTWYVYSVDISQQSLFATLHGYDALYGAFNDKFALNSYSSYTTLGTLATAICNNVGIPLYSNTFTNYNTQVSYANVGDDVSLRGIISYIAACAGGFARMRTDYVDVGGDFVRRSSLEIVSYTSERNLFEIDGDRFFHFTTDSPFTFQLNRIQYGKSGETLSSKAISTDLPASAENTIQVIDNPFFTAGVAQSLIDSFRNNTLWTYGATLEWRGNPTFKLGDAMCVWDEETFIPTSQRFTFDGGLKCEISTALSESYGETTNYAAVGNAITQSGELNGSRLVADSVTARAIAAGTITANEIGAGAITAEKIASETITGDKISAHAITTEKIATNAITASSGIIESINASKITVGELSAEHLNVRGTTIQGELSTESLAYVLNDIYDDEDDDNLKINGNCIKANTISSLRAGTNIILSETQCKISSEKTIISVPQTGETDRDIVRINDEGLTAEVISSPSVAPAKTGGSFTVGTNGTDNYHTLSAALADFSYCCLRGDVTITVSSADNGGELIGVYGGNITIQSANSRVTVASLTVRGCASTVTIKDLEVTNGISVIGSNVEVTGCLLSCSTALYARMSNVIMDNNDGDSAVCVDARASNVHLYQTYPKGTFNGGQVYRDENAQQSGTSSPTPHTEKTKYTKSYTADHAGSNISDGNRGYNNGDIRQGATSTTKFTGACWFGGASQGSIAESNPTLTGMRLTISRVSGFGGSSATTVKIWGVGNAYSSGVTPSRITESDITLSPKIGNGATVTYSLDINSNLAKGIFAFLRGTNTTYKPGFVFFNNEAIASPYSANYCNISGLKSGNPPVLTVEYEA